MPKKDYRHVRRAAVVSNPSGQQIKLGGYRPDKIDPNAKSFQAGRSHDLPPTIDLRPYMTPVENQGDSNSCTANAMAGAYEYLAKRTQGSADDVSRLFVYYNARKLDGDTEQDEGTYLQSCVKVMRKYGTCSEQTWPFDLERLYHAPPKKAYREAATLRVEDAYRVDVDRDTMRSCLAAGYPFAFGLQLFGSFQKAGANGLVPMPDPDSEQHDGGHAMLCVGYSDADQVFIVRNSWGPDWGDRGYCYIPYAYMTHPDLNGDLWSVRSVNQTGGDLSQGIQGKASGSLFDPEIAAIATAIQVPGATEGPDGIVISEVEYSITYDELLIYLDGQGYIAIDECDDLEALYYEEYAVEYVETFETDEAIDFSEDASEDDLENEYDEDSEASDEEASDEEFEEEEGDEESSEEGFDEEEDEEYENDEEYEDDDAVDEEVEDEENEEDEEGEEFEETEEFEEIEEFEEETGDENYEGSDESYNEA